LNADVVPSIDRLVIVTTKEAQKMGKASNRSEHFPEAFRKLMESAKEKIN
jgi:hypothetical protein